MKYVGIHISAKKMILLTLFEFYNVNYLLKLDKCNLRFMVLFPISPRGEMQGSDDLVSRWLEGANEQMDFIESLFNETNVTVNC